MASRRKKAKTVLSRFAARGSPGPTPLFVIAGLPQSTALAAAATINNNRNSPWRAISSPFSRTDGLVYADDAPVIELGLLTCAFARSGAPQPQGVPTPSRIVIAYVLEDGFDRLWDVFGHAVFPIPLDHRDWKWPKGQHWRHDIETVNLLLQRALEQAESKESEALRLRLQARRSDDILLLPGRNFHIDDERLAARFRLFMSNRLSLPGIEAGIHVERFPYERLAPFYDRVGGRNKRFAVDSRNIVFAKSNYGQHGGQHAVPVGEMTPQLLQHTLESRFRFGTPLEPEGFQHDAQRESGAQLVNECFDCVIKGPIQRSGSHANVFSSDVVT